MARNKQLKAELDKSVVYLLELVRRNDNLTIATEGFRTICQSLEIIPSTGESSKRILTDDDREFLSLLFLNEENKIEGDNNVATN